MNTEFYVAFNEWIEAQPKSQKVHTLNDKQIKDLYERIQKAGGLR